MYYSSVLEHLNGFKPKHPKQNLVLPKTQALLLQHCSSTSCTVIVLYDCSDSVLYLQ
jgi:hypothetical protein